MQNLCAYVCVIIGAIVSFIFMNQLIISKYLNEPIVITTLEDFHENMGTYAIYLGGIFAGSLIIGMIIYGIILYIKNKLQWPFGSIKMYDFNGTFNIMLIKLLKYSKYAIINIQNYYI
jgi:hypothetical protein